MQKMIKLINNYKLKIELNQKMKPSIQNFKS